MTAPLRTGEGPGIPGPSTNILLVVLIFSGLGFGIGAGAVEGSGAAFAFVIAGWVLASCLHAFGASLVGLRWGLPGTDALTLDPLRVPDPVATLLLPVAFTILAGFGFPGGSAARGDAALSRGRRSALAAAGPACRLAVLLGFVGLYALADPGSAMLRAVLAVSVLFQGTALVLGLMPVPGLDGFAILRPWLPDDRAGPGRSLATWSLATWSWATWSWADRMARHSELVLLGLFLLSGAFSRPLLRASLRLTAGFGIDLSDVIAGYRLIRLW